MANKKDAKKEVEAIAVSEVEFLKSILLTQKEKGFGNHLDEVILDRIKLIEGHDKFWIESGQVVSGDE